MAYMTRNRLVEATLVSGCALGLVGGVVLVGGCGKGDRWWKDNDPIVVDEDGDGSGGGPEEVDTSLSALARDSDPVVIEGGEGNGGMPRTTGEDFGTTRDRALESARMMDEYFSGMNGEDDLVEAVVIDAPVEAVDVGREMGGETGTPTNLEVSANEGVMSNSVDGDQDGSFSLSTAMAERGETPVVDDSGESPEIDTSEALVDAEQRKAELVSELVLVLTDLARTSDDPGRAVATLAGMESMSVETLKGLRDEGVLSDSELSTLSAVREMFDGVVSSGEIASPEEVGDLLTRLKDDLDLASGIRVSRALLCMRVDGFGKYEPFGSNEFVAGRAQEVIVYVEVDRFAQRELTGNDGQPRFEVEMSQRLELYHVADDLNTWNRAAEIDRSVSRNRVRDYYLINKITLPANLGVGRYHLKVVMRDLVGERIGESIIPIRMVVR